MKVSVETLLRIHVMQQWFTLSDPAMEEALHDTQRITIRLSADVVQRFRDTGDGWQTRVDAALKDWHTSHQPARG